MPITPPAALVRHLRERRCVLFAGSGLSASAGLPTWKTLLSELLDELRAEQPDRIDLEELKKLLSDGKYLEIADYCKEQLGEQRYSQFLTNRLRGADEEIPESHKIIAQLPFVACITTNYDKLLERAYYDHTKRIPRTPIHADVETLGLLLFDKNFFLLKAHGDIDKPETLVFTTRDYQEIIHSNPAFNSVLSALLLTNAILFIGYSLNDPDFRILLDKQLTTFNKYIPERYALVSGAGNVEKDVLWRTARIQVLSYKEGRHEEVVHFLHALKNEVEMNGPEKIQPLSQNIRIQKIEDNSEMENTQVEIDDLGGRIVQTTHVVFSLRLKGLQIESALKTSRNEVCAQSLANVPDWSVVSRLLRQAASYLGMRGPGNTGEASVREIGKVLANCFSKELQQTLQLLPPDQIVMLDLSPEIETLPWELTNIDSDFLCVRSSIVRAPIGISNEARGYAQVRQPVRVLLIGDPTDILPGARREVEEIAKIYEKRDEVTCTMLLGSQATFDNVVKLLLTDDFDIVHFAGHAWFDEQQSFLALHGEVELRANELRSLLSKQPPAILILNSHYTAFIPLGGVGSGEASSMSTNDLRRVATISSAKRGFTDAALTAGVGALIGCIGSPSDDIATDFGIALHQKLLEGASLAMAFHQARRLSMQNEQQDLSGLWYVISGYPDLALH